MIEVSAETIERVERILAGVPKGAERALSNAINRAVSHAKTNAFKGVREVYTVKQGDLNSRTQTKVKKASAGDVVGIISFAGVKLPLYKFNTTPRSPIKGKKVWAEVMKGGGTTFESAFIADLGNGTGVFERVSSERYPTEQLMGLSAAQMIQNENIVDRMTQDAQEKFNERLEHEIERILNGYGG